MIRKIPLTSNDLQKMDTMRINPASQFNTFINYVDVLVEKPWGHEYSIFENDSVAIWVLCINNGFQTSMHCHLTKKTSLFVLKGVAECSTLNERITVRAGEGLQIERGVFHSTKAVSPDGILMIESETPNNKNELMRLFDKYGRENKPYQVDPQTTDMSKVIASFHNPLERYDTTRAFGDHTLTVIKCRGDEDFKSKIVSLHADAVTVLRGNILDADMKSIISTGDLVDVVFFTENEKLQILDDLILLLIKKK